jgi:hypothetical protein
LERFNAGDIYGARVILAIENDQHLVLPDLLSDQHIDLPNCLAMSPG